MTNYDYLKDTCIPEILNGQHGFKKPVTTIVCFIYDKLNGNSKQQCDEQDLYPQLATKEQLLNAKKELQNTAEVMEALRAVDEVYVNIDSKADCDYLLQKCLEWHLNPSQDVQKKNKWCKQQ